jgi:hypothetical protein
MVWLIGFVALLLSVWPSLAYGQSRVFECNVKNAVDLTASGELARSNLTTLHAKRPIRFDEASSLLSAFGGEPFSMKIVQRGSSANDLVAARSLQAQTVVRMEVLRIRVWETPHPFIFLSDTQVLSGTCSAPK